jgi:tRNA pseudouridine65 synthase
LPLIEILHHDAELLVVNKPAGLLTHRSEMASESDVAMTRARDAVGAHVWPLHRLDRGTSGALAFALSAGAARTWSGAFERGEVEKVYLALVRGEPPESILVDYPVPKGEGRERVPAVTELRRLFAGGFFSLVEARPRTGRFHQIRRHLSHLRHPIAGDSNYGTGWFNRKLRSEAGLMRLGLHAVSICLPADGGPRRVRAPLASDFVEALARLGVPPEVSQGYC